MTQKNESCCDLIVEGMPFNLRYCPYVLIASLMIQNFSKNSKLLQLTLRLLHLNF